MLSRQWPRPISTNAASHAHHVSMTTAAATTPNVCTSAITTVITLRTVGMRRSSSRSGRTGMARALRRSVGRTSGRRSLGGHHRRAPSPPIIHHMRSSRSTCCNDGTLAARGRRSVRSTPARSCCRSCSASTRRCCRCASLVAIGELFGIAPGTMRTALSRMVAAGELSVDDDGYRLVGRLLERKAAQDIGRRPAPGPWDGTWWVAVVTAPRRVDRRAAGVPHRTWPTCGWASCGRTRGCARPTSTARPATAALAVVRGALTGEDPAELAARLWPLAGARRHGDAPRRPARRRRRRRSSTRGPSRCRRRSRSPPRSCGSCAPSRCSRRR